MLPVRGDWDLPVGPLTGQVDTDAGHNGRGVLQAEGGQVQADVTGRENKKPSTPTPELRIHAGHGGECGPLDLPRRTLGHSQLHPAPGTAGALRPLRLFRAWFATGGSGSPPQGFCSWVFVCFFFRKVIWELL